MKDNNDNLNVKFSGDAIQTRFIERKTKFKNKPLLRISPFFHANALIFSFTRDTFYPSTISPVLLLGVCICSVTHLMNRLCSLCWLRGSISRVLGTERNLIGWNFVQEVRLEKHARHSASTRTSPLLSPSKPTSSVIARFNCSLVTRISCY